MLPTDNESIPGGAMLHTDNEEWQCCLQKMNPGGAMLPTDNESRRGMLHTDNESRRGNAAYR